MQHKLLSVLAKSTLGLALAVVAASSFAQAKKEVTFAHQDMVFPYRTVMEYVRRRRRRDQSHGVG